jgi:hypothetical protein
MTEMQKIIFTKPTIISIVGLILIMIGLPYGIYGLTLDGGSSLGGVLILIGVFIIFLIYIADRIASEKVNTKKLNIIETVLIVSSVLIFSFTNREVIFDISQNDSNYFVLIENNGHFRNSELNFSFPFDKKIVLKNNYAVINSIEDNYQRINIEESNKWNGLRMQPWPINKVNIQFYSNPDLEFDEKEIDSIIKKEIKTAVNSYYDGYGQ